MKESPHCQNVNMLLQINFQCWTHPLLWPFYFLNCLHIITRFISVYCNYRSRTINKRAVRVDFSRANFNFVYLQFHYCFINLLYFAHKRRCVNIKFFAPPSNKQVILRRIFWASYQNRTETNTHKIPLQTSNHLLTECIYHLISL